MALNYASWVTGLANLLVVPSTDSNFTTVLPNIIDDVEGRMFRDLDLMATRVTDSNTNLTQATRTVALSTVSGSFVVIEEINVITPSTATAATGYRVPLTRVSREFIDACFPGSSLTNQPGFWSMTDNANIIVGPAPNSSYAIEVVGTVQPNPLSSTNSSNVFTRLLPDVYMAASCVYGAAYLKNFGAQADDPKSGLSWEQVYQSRMQSAAIQEFRIKYQSQGWTAQQPNPVASPPRV